VSTTALFVGVAVVLGLLLARAAASPALRAMGLELTADASSGDSSPS